MKIYKTTTFILLFLAFGLQDAIAQPVNPAEPEALKITFSVFPLTGADWEGIYYFPDGNPEKSEEIRFNLYRRSNPYKYEGQAPLKFYRKKTDSEGATQYSVVGVVHIPKGITRGDLILFFEPTDENGPYQISTMFDSKTSYPEDSLVIFNTMSITFKAVIGKTAFEIPPGASPPISTKPFIKNAVPIAMAIDHDNDLHLVLKNQMRFSEGRKTLLILRKPMNRNSLRIRSQRLTEFSSKEEEKNDSDS